MNRNLALLAVISTLAAPVAAHAQTVYDNGAFTGAAEARNISLFAVADDFAVAGSLTFDAVRFYAVDLEEGLLPSFGGTLSWFIYESTGTTPNAIPTGNIVASGTVSGSNIVIADTGQTALEPAVEVAQLDFVIPAQTLTSGTYWLRVKEGAPTEGFDGSEVFWLQTGSAITGNGFRSDSDEVAPTTWGTDGTETGNDLAFQLRNTVAVPEAGAGYLTAFALPIAAFVAARRKK